MKKNEYANRLDIYFLLGSVVILFFLLIFRNTGLYPVVMSDEYWSSTCSRLLPMTDCANRPIYLYLLIYRFTNWFGDGFLVAGRVLNVLFFLASTPFIYWTARRVCSQRVASFVTVLILLGPINSYTAYFMPETLYFFTFWVFAWFMLSLDRASPWWKWCVGGVIWGLLALIKPHAVLVFPALTVYTVYLNLNNRLRGWVGAIGRVSLLISSFFAVKMLVGYACAGSSGLTLLGSEYGSIAGSTALDVSHYIQLFKWGINNIAVHGLVVCLLFGLPVAGSVACLLFPENTGADSFRVRKMSFFAWMILLNLIVVTGLFTASVVGQGPYETATRLHMRYYNFSLPLLLIITASQLSPELRVKNRRLRALTAIPVCVAMLYAGFAHMAPDAISFIDNPDLRGFRANPLLFYVLTGLSVLSLVVWVYASRLGVKFFIYLFLPLAVATSSFYVNRELRERLEPDIFDKAGVFVKQYLSDQEISRVLVAGSEPSGLFRTLFHLDNAKADLLMLEKGAPFSMSCLAADKDFVLLVGNHPVVDSAAYNLSGRGFKLLSSQPFPILNTFGTSLLKLPRTVGVADENALVSDGRTGFLAYGPYIPVEAGDYKLVLYGAGVHTDSCWVDITSGGGTVQYAQYPLVPVLSSQIIHIDEDVDDLEVRVFVGAGDRVRLEGYELVRTDDLPCPEVTKVLPARGLDFSSESLSALPRQVGSVDGNALVSDGQAGFLAFGPYASVSAGSYRLTLYGSAEYAESSWADVVSGSGTTRYNRWMIQPMLASEIINIDESADDIEIRVFVDQKAEVKLEGYQLIPYAVARKSDCRSEQE